MTTLAIGLDSLFSPTHMIILLVIALLVFGRRLPEVGRNLGRGIVEFKKGLKDVTDAAMDDQPRQPAQHLPPPTGPAPQIQPPRDTQGQDVRVSRNDVVQ